MHSRLRLVPSLAAALVLATAACSGGGAQSGAMMPVSNGALGSSGGVGNAVVRIFVPASTPNSFGRPAPILQPPVGGPQPPGGLPNPGGAFPAPGTPIPGPPAPPPPPGAQVLSINLTGPATISQSVTVGPNASGCAPAPGGTSCQLTLPLPAGTYTGTIGTSNASAPTAIAFTVTPNGQNVFSMATSGVPAQLVLLPASPLSAMTSQGELDLYGAGRHALLVEALDANQNMILGGIATAFSLSQAGGTQSLAISQATNSPANLFYVSPGALSGNGTASLRASANYAGSGPCSQPNAACTGTVRVAVRQLLAVANSNANNVTLYVGGQSFPVVTVQNSVALPQALTFDPSGNLFVANQPGSVTVYAPPYNSASATIANGVNRPQALAVDLRGNLFIANGSGTNTVTLYSPPYGNQPAATISSGIDDPVSLAVDTASDLFVVNQSANTVTIYQPPYASPPTVISKGLNAPNSLALDSHGNLFVANLNSTPNSVVEYSSPFSNQSTPIATITNGVNEQGAIGLSGSANLFVPNQGANTVTEYVAPYVNPPVTIVGGQSQPIALAVDGQANLYVANYGNNTVTEYAPPYANAGWTTLSNGISLPIALALSPATSPAAVLVP